MPYYFSYKIQFFCFIFSNFYLSSISLSLSYPNPKSTVSLLSSSFSLSCSAAFNLRPFLRPPFSLPLLFLLLGCLSSATTSTQRERIQGGRRHKSRRFLFASRQPRVPAFHGRSRPSSATPNVIAAVRLLASCRSLSSRVPQFVVCLIGVAFSSWGRRMTVTSFPSARVA